MTKEHPDRSAKQGFDFTEREELFDRVSDKRFKGFFDDEQTTVHRIELSSNSFGEFIFITLSRPSEHQRQPVTFYSKGFHDYRERWIYLEWYWYEANAHPVSTSRKVPKEEAREILKRREEEIAPYVKRETQTWRGQFFEALADVVDEDGAMSEMDDLADFLDDL